jgi:hypothetical protein
MLNTFLASRLTKLGAMTMVTLGDAWRCRQYQWRTLRCGRQDNKIDKIVVRTSQHTYLYFEKNNFYTVQAEKDYWAVGFDLYLMNYRSNN